MKNYLLFIIFFHLILFSIHSTREDIYRLASKGFVSEKFKSSVTYYYDEIQAD